MVDEELVGPDNKVGSVVMKGFVSAENDGRIGSYRKDVVSENRFKRMNLALCELEEQSLPRQDYPTLFIFGLPRSATTLTYQLISQCLDLGYVNTLIARFWLSPQHGIALRQAVLGSLPEATFRSDFGKSEGPYGPHEFAYFWHHWLKVVEVDDMLAFGQSRDDIDWAALGRTVRCMQDMFGTGIVFKTPHVANHMRAFAAAFAMPLFIYIERDPTDVALSILGARIAYYGRPDIWWSTHPPNYRKLAVLPFPQQIAGQVHSLRSTYEREMRRLPPELVLRVRYSQLCSSPGDIVTSVQERVAAVHGVTVCERFDSPDCFAFKTRPEVLDASQKAVVTAMMANEE